MELQRIEAADHTADQIIGYVRTVEELVERLEIACDRDSPFYLKLLDLVAAKTVTLVQTQAQPVHLPVPEIGLHGLSGFNNTGPGNY